MITHFSTQNEQKQSLWKQSWAARKFCENFLPPRLPCLQKEMKKWIVAHPTAHEKSQYSNIIGRKFNESLEIDYLKFFSTGVGRAEFLVVAIHITNSTSSPM